MSPCPSDLEDAPMGSFGTKLPEAVAQLATKRLADPLPLWKKAHWTRRSGVMVILSPRNDDLEVLLTVRSQQLSYGGDGALPGGKADNSEETPWEVASRETCEEVGITSDLLHHVTTLPGYVSSKLLLVVPSVAWTPEPLQTFTEGSTEVHKVFRVPLSRFLSAEGHHFEQGQFSSGAKVKLSHFDILAAEKRVGDPKYDRVWGLTANILIDCARLVFNKEPEFKLHRHIPSEKGATDVIDGKKIGNQVILEQLEKQGILQSEVKRQPAL